MESPLRRYSHSLILLTYNKPALLDARVLELDRIYPGEFEKGGLYELLIFDNGSTDVNHKLAMATFEKTGLNTHRVDSNIGFGQGFNKAVELTDGEVIHLISNDVKMFGDFITAVDCALKQVPRTVVGQNMIVGRAGWNCFGDHPPIIYLAGHYLAMLRTTWEEIGGFDKRFYPYDYEDVDLSMMAQTSGICLTDIPTLPIEHQVAGTIAYGPDRMAHTVKMRAKFAEKWDLLNVPEAP